MKTLESPEFLQEAGEAVKELDASSNRCLLDMLSCLDFEPQLAALVPHAIQRSGAVYAVALAEGEEPGTLRVGVSSGESADARHLHARDICDQVFG